MIKRCLVFTMVASFAFSCTLPEDEGGEGKQVGAKLQSSNLQANGLRLQNSVTLTNVTGLADSIGFSGVSSGSCGFNVWAADGQTTRSGMENRSYEAFDLGDPVSWTSLGAGLQGECDSIQIQQVEAYFVYLDMILSVSGTAKTVRVYMGQQSPFEAGDLALVEGSDLSWYDEDTEALVGSDETRPDNPASVDLGKEIPWYDNNGTEKIILMEFRINLDDINAYTVTKETGHAIVDIDFSNSGIDVGDASDDASLLATIELPFLKANEYSNLLVASLELSNDRPAEEEAGEE